MTLANWSILASSSTQEFTLNSTFDSSVSVVSVFFLVCKKGLLLKSDIGPQLFHLCKLCLVVLQSLLCLVAQTLKFFQLFCVTMHHLVAKVKCLRGNLKDLIKMESFQCRSDYLQGLIESSVCKRWLLLDVARHLSRHDINISSIFFTSVNWSRTLCWTIVPLPAK